MRRVLAFLSLGFPRMTGSGHLPGDMLSSLERVEAGWGSRRAVAGGPLNGFCMNFRGMWP